LCNGVIRNNRIVGNFASQDMLGRYPADGGGVFGCLGVVEGNLIAENGAEGIGGGVAYCTAILKGNWVCGNEAVSGGGIGESGYLIFNNVLSMNSAVQNGGGVYEFWGLFVNNTVTDNTSLLGGGIFSFSDERRVAAIQNSILWGNAADSSTQMLTDSPVSYCCIQFWPTALGVGNLDVDPGLVDAARGDFRLLSASPCIDAGGVALDVEEDLDGSVRPMDGVADTPPRGDGSGWDIGAYEYLGPLLPTPTPSPDLIRDVLLKRTFHRPYIDLNVDDLIDVADLVLTLAASPR